MEPHISTPKDATEKTKAANLAVHGQLPFHDKQDFDDASHGLIATTDDFPMSPEGRPIWTLQGYEFLQNEQPADTVNPSLWRQAQLNMNHGLFAVTDRIYQIRGFDLSNMTIIEGDTGLIVVDPLITREMAQCGMALYHKHRPGEKPVIAVIYTHSHIDHYGGVKGVVSEAEVQAGKVKIYAPEGFLKEVISENVYAGNAMGRRAVYMYGALLPRNEKGQLDGGLGKTTSLGTTTLIPPTDSITQTGEKHTIDGVEFVFQMAPNTEAPAEMLFYMPQMRALCAAEDATHTMHNLYTLRGAQVRDAAAWWKTINTSLELFGDKTDVIFASHHWPTWGNERIAAYLSSQRDLYKYIHDQTLRHLNKGLTATEIAEVLQLPDSLAKTWANRGYYGSLNHNVKAIYQRYLGWYDSNPANLYNHPPVEAAKRYVVYMGGADSVLQKARQAFEEGDYRWVAEVVKHVVFADPSNREAKELQADALEQLGYQTENPTWRNEFLMGAFELRNAIPTTHGANTIGETAQAMPVDMILDFLGIRLNDGQAAGKTLTFNLTLDTEKYAVTLQNAALTYTAEKQTDSPDFSIEGPRAVFAGLAFGALLPEEATAKGLTLSGNQEKFTELFSLFESFDPAFPIVTP